MPIQKSYSYKTIGWLLLVGLILYIPTIHNLGNLPIRHWDESLFGLRALYMYNTGSYMADFQLYEGLMPHLNTKLPFTTWIQVLFIKIFGVNIIALRLPIVIIFLATIGFVLRFSKKHLSSIIVGVLFVMILACSHGIVRSHILRTGDQDLPFICYILIMVISYFQYTQNKNRSYLYLFALSITAALLTKNLLAGAFLPGLLLYTLITKKLTETLKDKNIWIIIFVVLLIFSSVIFYLNHTYPGFIERMWGYELLGRYTDAKDGHRGGVAFFFNELAFTSFKIYFWLVPLSLLVLLSKKLDHYKKQFIICLACVYFSYFAIITFAETKLFWYGVPVIPFGALMIALALHHLYEEYTDRWSKTLKYSLVLVISLLLFALPYRATVQYVFNNEIEHEVEKFGPFIKQLSIDKPIFKRFTLAGRIFDTPAMWYKEKYNLEGYDLRYSDDTNFGNGEIVMTCLKDVGEEIHKSYEYQVIYEWERCKLIKIIKQK